MADLSLADANHQIDTYMADQGDGDSMPPLSQSNLAARVPQIEALKSSPMEPGQTWFLVSSAWYKRWKKACTGEVDKEGGVNPADLGPMDNDDIMDNDGIDLRTHLVEHEDIEFVPEEAWKLFTTWFVSSLIHMSKFSF